jgi:nitronate monooxygenase
VKEAILLKERGVDLIVAQGSEAGGHRGTFAAPYRQALVGTMALVPQIVDQVDLPVIAAGGIAEARGVVASLVLGASGVQMGTVFLTCQESGAHVKYKEAVLQSAEDSTVITRALTGKPARGMKNAIIEALEAYEGEVPSYPIQNALTRDLRQAAAKRNSPDWMSLWAGQSTRFCAMRPAKEVVETLVQDISRVMEVFHAQR